MLKKNRQEVNRLVKLAKITFSICPDTAEGADYVKGFYDAQVEVVGMMLDKIAAAVNQKEEDEF